MTTSKPETQTEKFERIAREATDRCIANGGHELPEDDGRSMQVVFVPPPRKPPAR